MQRTITDSLTLDRVLESAADGIFIIDADGRLAACSPACRAMIGKTDLTISARGPVSRIFSGNARTERRIESFETATGENISADTTYAAISDGNGGADFVVGIMRPVADRARASSSANGNGNTGGVDIPGQGPLDAMLSTLERGEIIGALKKAGGQRTKAAELLGISRSRLYRRMEALAIDPKLAGDD